MIEVTGNLWEYPADVRVITTNGAIRKDGQCVMGRGCAREAKDRIPGLALTLGKLINEQGNHVHRLGWEPPEDLGARLYSFPVKHLWHQLADPVLIVRSSQELVEKTLQGWDKGYSPVIVTPRPGCGNGGLRWDDVHPLIEPILDDRFHIITFGAK